MIHTFFHLITDAASQKWLNSPLFFPKPAERIVFLSTRSQTNLIGKNIFLLIALAIADSKVDSRIHVIVYDDSIVHTQKNKQILQFYFVIYTFYCLVLRRKKKINKQAFFSIID